MDNRFDVLIYEVETGKVDTVAGTNLNRESGFHNAEKRLDTVLPRLNDHYNATIVETGKYKVGDVLKKGDR